MGFLGELNQIISPDQFRELAINHGRQLAEQGKIVRLDKTWIEDLLRFANVYGVAIEDERQMDKHFEEKEPEDGLLVDAGIDPEKVKEQGRVFVNTLVEKIKLEKEVENLKSVMVAAAEEIMEHWDAHCDKEGYGPSNLMHRLEKGLGADYSGYKPGAFKRLQDQVEELRRKLDR